MKLLGNIVIRVHRIQVRCSMNTCKQSRRRVPSAGYGWLPNDITNDWISPVLWAFSAFPILVVSGQRMIIMAWAEGMPAGSPNVRVAGGGSTRFTGSRYDADDQWSRRTMCCVLRFRRRRGVVEKL